MTTLNKMIEESIEDNGGSLSRVSRALGLDYHALMARFPQTVTTLKIPVGGEPEDIRTLGREGKQHFVIAVKPVGSRWPEKYSDVIEDARRKFDAGTHEMFQTTNPEGWVVQYLIPRLIPTSRRQFFSSMIRM